MAAGFCEDPLWDANLTWNTDNPDFTTCFHETVLVYVPAALLLLLSPLQFYGAVSSRDRHIPWSLISFSRLAANCTLTVLPIIDLAYELVHRTSDGIYPVHLVSASVKIISYGLALVIATLCRRRGLVSSGALTIFWLSAAICGAFTFRSVLTTPYLAGDDKILPFITYTVQYPLVLVLFLLSLFADPEPKYMHFDGKCI